MNPANQPSCEVPVFPAAVCLKPPLLAPAPMFPLFASVLAALCSSFRTRAALQLEKRIVDPEFSLLWGLGLIGPAVCRSSGH